MKKERYSSIELINLLCYLKYKMFNFSNIRFWIKNMI